jgi:hypothetical protein
MDNRRNGGRSGGRFRSSGPRREGGSFGGSGSRGGSYGGGKPREGGSDRPQGGGGFGGRPREGGFSRPDNRGGSGGFGGNRPREGGYSKPREGGFGGSRPREGGFSRPREGGFGGRPREGGFSRPREGGFGGPRREGSFGGGSGNLRERFMHKARQKFEEYRAREDLYLMEVDRAIVDLDKTTNLIGERLEEWLSFYIGGIRLADRVNLAKLIILIADNREINPENVGQILNNKETELVLNKIMGKARDIQEKDLVYIKRYAESLIYLNDLKLFYEEEIDSLANRIAPNATYMVGGKVVAKMISIAKGLDRLVEMPASTVQLLGAENALFTFIKGGKRGDPPKHGVILFAPQVAAVRKENRGKMARTLAAKLLIAFKVDNNKGEFIGKQLKEAVERRMKSLM